MKKLLTILFLSLSLCVPAFALQSNLGWTAPTTFSDGTTIPTGTAISYDVFRATLVNLSDAIKLNALPVTNTTYSDTTIVTGKTYYYFTRAYINPALPSGNSNVVVVITLLPSAPSGLTGVVVP